MTPEDIRIAIIRAKTTAAKIGREMKPRPYTRFRVSQVIHGADNPHIQKAVAAAIKTPVAEVFPHYQPREAVA